MFVTTALLGTGSAWLVMRNSGEVTVTAPLEIAPTVPHDGSLPVQTSLSFSTLYGPRWRFYLDNALDFHLSAGTASNVFYIHSDMQLPAKMTVPEGGSIELRGSSAASQLIAISPVELSRVSIVESAGSYLSVFAPAEFYSTLSVAGDTHFSALSVQQNLHIGNTLSVAEDLIIGGSLSLLNTLNVTSVDVVFQQSLEVRGPTSLTTANIDIALVNNLEVNSTLQVDGSASIDNALTTETLIVLDDAAFGSKVDIADALTVGADGAEATMDFTGNSTFVGNLTVHASTEFTNVVSCHDTVFVEDHLVLGVPPPFPSFPSITKPLPESAPWWNGIDEWNSGEYMVTDILEQSNQYPTFIGFEQLPYDKARMMVHGTLNVSRQAYLHGDVTVGTWSFGHHADDIDVAWELYTARVLSQQSVDAFPDYGPPTFGDLHTLYHTSMGIENALGSNAHLKVYGDATVHASLNATDLNVRGYAHIGADFRVNGPSTFQEVQVHNALTVEGKTQLLSSLTVHAGAILASMESYSGGGYLAGEWIADNVVSSSDRRLKNAIYPLNKEIPSALGVIESLIPCSYTFHNDETTRFGFIADEISEILPTIVHTLPSGYQGVRYQDLIPVLVQAIQEQSRAMQEILQAQSRTLEQAQVHANVVLKDSNPLDGCEGAMRHMQEELQRERAAFRLEVEHMRSEHLAMARELVDSVRSMHEVMQKVGVVAAAIAVFFWLYRPRPAT